MVLTAGVVCSAGLAGAAPPTPDSLRIPGAPAGAGTPLARPGAARAAAITEPALLRRLQAGASHDFFIELNEQADLKAAYGMTWRERGRYVFKTLRDTADRSQAKLRAALASQGATIRPYWIKNGVFVRGGNLAALETAAGVGDVKRIVTLPGIKAIEPVKREAASPLAANGITENVRRIGADRVWEQGTTGNGVTVGIIDDGVSDVHPALRQSYRGYRAGGSVNDYNWFDPEARSSSPRMTDEHGSHVTGIVMGDSRDADPALRERIGVAPGARWVGCLALGTETGAPHIMLDCLQFMLAPTRTDGTLPDPDQRPDIVNNSWVTNGSCDGQAVSEFSDAIDAWVAAGVLPVFANGNTTNCDLPQPPGLSTVAAPASLAASFAVGSTGNHNGLYAPHSLWGPTAAVSPGLPVLPDPRGYPQLKPQVVAPGVSIRSSFGGGGYGGMTGSSMSAPHVAGAFALMIEAGECLRGDYARLGTILMQTARPVPYDSGGSPAPGPGNVPNYATGWGEIDTFAAVNAAANACGPQGFLRGRVAGADGRGVSGAKIEILTNTGTPVHELIADVDGSYIRRLPQSSTGYTVRVSAYGFLADSESGLSINADGTTRHDVTLAAAAMHKVTGRVTDAATGWPLHARITIAGYPDGALWTDPVTGTYAVRLPEGTAFRFDLTSDIPGYQPATRDVADASVVTQDFTLDADRVSCAAPGYRFAQTFVDETFETNGAGAPAGWTAASAGVGWRFGTSDDVNGKIFYVPEHGRYAATNEEHGVDMGWGNDGSAEYLTLPAINLAGAADPTLHFQYAFPRGFMSTAAVQGSVDGGATWLPLGAVNAFEDWPVWTGASVSLAPIAGAANARVRFHVDDGTTVENPQVLGAVFALDDVAINAGCTAPAQGGLVVGHVRDANSAAKLDGAIVSIGSAGTTSVTSLDPNIGAGFYALYAAPGAATINATRGTLPAGYGDGTANASVAAHATIAADVTLPAGRLRLYPSSGPSATLALGTTANVDFTVRNTGTAPLTYAFERTAIEQHFEGAFPPAGWTVTHDGPATCVWRALDPDRFANYAGGDGAAAMVYGYDCFKTTDPIDTSFVSPIVDLSSSNSASLGFFLSFAPGGDDAPRLDADISRDGGATWTTFWTLTQDVSGQGPGALTELDLTPYVGSATTRVRLRYQSTPPNSRVIIDQLHLFDGAGMSPWLDLAPDHGALAAGASHTLTATLDARGITQPGTYTVPIRVAENTPYDWPFDGELNATLTVTAPASYGGFVGTVRGLGACDIAPTTLPGATVRIRNANGTTVETTSDADGKFRYWLPAADGPFTLTAQAADHRDAAAQTLALTPGSETAANVDLRALLPCLLTDPAQMTAHVVPGGSSSVPVLLMNGGAAPALWNARAGGDPAERVALPITQTTSPDPEANMWTACVAGGGVTLENHFMRKFPLRDRPEPGEVFSVPGIEFAIDTAFSPKGQQMVHARLYALRGDGTMRFANLELLREKTLTIADTQLDRLRVTFDEPVTVGRDATLIVSVHAPDGSPAGSTFALGFNTAGQTADSYLSSPACDTLDPTPLSEIDPRLSGFHMLLELDVLGSAPCHERATPVTWASFTPAAGSLAADTTAPLTARLDAAALGNGTYAGTLCVAPVGSAPTVVPVTLDVGNDTDTIFKNGFE